MTKLVSGVYQIVGPEGQAYVGSAKTVSDRLSAHKHMLKGGIHHCTPLQDDWNKHGASAFKFEPLMYFPVEDIRAAEQSVLDKLWGTGTLYNIAPDANKSALGLKRTVTQATRDKVSLSLKGNTRNLGNRASPETKEKISQSLMGNQRRLGHPHSAESKSKLSLALKGRVLSPEHRAKLSASLRLRQYSTETRAKMSASAKKRWGVE